MKGIIIVLVCAMIAPLAFAQTNPTTTQQTTATQPAAAEMATTYTAGVVTKYQPDKTIMVSSNQGPVSFALGTSARIVDAVGNAVTSEVKPGAHVRVYYTGTGTKRMVERIVVVGY
jgi:hypothetical protein